MGELWGVLAEAGADPWAVEEVECVLPKLHEWRWPAAGWMRKAEREVEKPPARLVSHAYDARMHEYDLFIGSPYEVIPKGIDPSSVLLGAARYGWPQPREDESPAERYRVVDAHRTAVLSDAAMVQRIRENLKGKRLACTCAGWRCHVDNLAEIANCSERELERMVNKEVAKKRPRYY